MKQAAEQSSIHFYERLSVMRLTAAVMFDQSIAAGATPETTAKNLEPITKKVEEVTRHAIQHDLPGVVFAIRALESDAMKHDQDARFLLDKAENSRAHVQRLKNALKDEMAKHGATERKHGDTFVTLVNGEINLR